MSFETLVTEPMLNSLLLIYSYVGSFGVAILLFTLFVRLITHPLTVSQLKSAQAMQDFQKSDEWQAIQKKYKNDKEKLQQEQVKLYSEKGINPLKSCLPLFVQLPIMMGFYQALNHALAVTPVQLLELSSKIYPFVDASTLIPINKNFLWMDLSQPERLPILGVGIPLLTILVVVTTYLQSKLMAPPPGNPGDQSAQMAQSMNMIMPLMMGWFAYSLASGLALYFFISNLFGILQYAMMGKANWHNLLPARKTSAKAK